MGIEAKKCPLNNAGVFLLRYGLVLVIGWIGLMKYTAYEANAIEGLVANSPLMGWLYNVLSVQGVSCVIGTFEIIIVIMIALRPVNALISGIGSLLAAGMFATTLTFLLSTPGIWEASLGGFPFISVMPGSFLLKDFVFLGAALFTASEALRNSTCAEKVE